MEKQDKRLEVGQVGEKVMRALRLAEYARVGWFVNSGRLQRAAQWGLVVTSHFNLVNS